MIIAKAISIAGQKWSRRIKVRRMERNTRKCERCGKEFFTRTADQIPLVRGFVMFDRSTNWCESCNDAFNNKDKPKCPFCLGVVNSGASKCVNCGSDLPEEELFDFKYETDYSLAEKEKEPEKDHAWLWIIVIGLSFFLFLFALSL